MQAIYSRFAAASVCFILASCGGKISSPSSEELAGDGSGTLTGYLFAPRVGGLSVNGALSGADGGFNYSAEQVLDIKLGSLEISNISARPRLNVYDLAGSAEQYRFDKAARVGRLLISLDSDGDARNGVQLDSVNADAGELDWQSTAGVWQAAAESLTYRLGEGSSQLVTAEQALETMASQFRAESENCSTAQLTAVGFSIADPSCADRARMGLWNNELSAAQLKLQSSLERFFSGELNASGWWALLQSDWQDLLQDADETQAWLSYALTGADVPTRRVIEQSLADGGAFSDSLQSELMRWRDGGGRAMLDRDEAERDLAAQVIQGWLSYGFDQQALRDGYGLSANGGSEAFVLAVAQREGIATNLLRVAVVDQQVYLALKLIDSLMNLQDDWVTGGSNSPGNIINNDGDTGEGEGGEPARVWRVSYEELTISTVVEFTVEGSSLTNDLSLVLSGCNNMQALSGSADAKRFSCDLTGIAGGRTLQVMDNRDGSLLYEAIVSVVGGISDDSNDAVVTGVSPARAQHSSSQLFSVVGLNFPTNMQFSLAGCLSPQVQLRSSTQLDVLCQLDDRATVRSGLIESASGNEIFRFNVSPVVTADEPMSAFSVTPAAAIEAETLEMVISGSGFGSDVQVQSSGCSSITLLSITDAEIRFRCGDAQLGTWPVSVISSQQAVLVPQSLQVRALEASVSSVSPLQGVEDEWVNLKVRGQYLSAGVEIELEACTTIENLDNTAVLRQFGCTLGAPGVYEGKVLVAGKELYRFDFSVEAKTSSNAIQASPTTSSYGEPLELTITGVDLPELAEVTMPNCVNIALLSASPSKMVFTCTPQQVGQLSGQLVDPVAGELLSFKVDIVDGNDPLDGVVFDSISPAITYLNAQTTFTVRGENLPTSLILSLEGCSAVEKLGGSDQQRQFRCIPKGSSGLRQISIYTSEGGALIGNADLQVTGNELRVSDVSPKQTAIGVQTTFRVTGQNLSSGVSFQLEGCDSRAQSSTSTEQRTYLCVPYGLPGTRTVRVLDRTDGTVLYSRAIDMLAAP